MQEGTPYSSSNLINGNNSPAKGLLETSTVVRHEMANTVERERQAGM